MDVSILSPRETQVYQYLFSKAGAPVPVEELFREIWKKDPAVEKTGIVGVTISYMRKKLGKDTILRKPDGYVLSAEHLGINSASGPSA